MDRAEHLPDLLLHLDINKTLILTDAASGSTLDDVIHSVLVANTLGTVSLPASAGQPPTWKAVDATVRPPSAPTYRTSTGPAAAEASAAEAGYPSSCSYGYFVREVLLPYVDAPSQPTPEARDAAVATNRERRDERKRVVNRFTERGQPGEAFRPAFEAMRARMVVPEDKRAACLAAGLGPLGGGSRLLLPSYFALLRHLVGSRRRFFLMFRTFGHDIVDVVAEHNAFCEGRHPLYPLHSLITGTGSEEGTRAAFAALVVRMPFDTGAFVRHGDGPASMRLACVLRGGGGGGGGGAGTVGFLVGQREIYGHLLSHLQADRDKVAKGEVPGGAAAAYRDDYEAWFASNERGHAGKLMPFEPADARVHSLFIDDNAGEYGDKVAICEGEDGEAVAARMMRDLEEGASSAPLPGREDDTGIVDARVVSNGMSLGWSEVKNTFVVACDAWSAASNESYFVELLRMCEASRRLRKEGCV
jgi:hypothetical protein